MGPLGVVKSLRRYRRYNMAMSYFKPRLQMIRKWTFNSNEESNFTYRLTDSNLTYLLQMCSVVTGLPIEQLKNYLDEASQNSQLRQHVREVTSQSGLSEWSDKSCEFGRRLGWYLLARATKPKVIVETGIDKGLGALLLNYALIKNAEEGAPGRYFGTDINPHAGYLLSSPYNKFGTILYGDSIESLKGLPDQIDLFINDSDHSADYETNEYRTVENQLSENALILGDNSHTTDCLSKFALRTGRKFLFFKEEPLDHWYPGAGIGICYKSVNMPNN